MYRYIVISVVFFSLLNPVPGQESASNLEHNSSGGVLDETRTRTADGTSSSTRRETLSDEFWDRSGHSLFESDSNARSPNAWLDDIRKLSIGSIGNISATIPPHPYILAVWRQMTQSGDAVPKLGRGPQSVVSIRADLETGSQTAGMSVVFDLTDVYVDGDTPVTVAQIILYKKTVYWDQLNLSAQDHLEVHISVCRESVSGSHSTACVHTYSRTLTRSPNNPEVFNITEATRSLLRENSPNMQVQLTAWLFSGDRRNQADPSLFFFLQDDQQGPLLILYRNMRPPVFQNLSANPRLKRQKQRQPRNAIHRNGQLNLDCRLHTWVVHFSTMHWSWIEEPKFYQANYCSGNCPSPLADKHYNSTNHTYIKNVFNVETNWQDQDIPRACCVPTHFQPLSMLYREGTAFVLKNIPEMIATSCACM